MTSLDPTRPWTSYPLVVLDFETTGVDPLTCGAVSVAAVRYEGGVEVGHFYTLLHPGCPIPESASDIHGITDADVKDALPLDAVAPELFERCKGAVPCAYNAAYDRQILHRAIAGKDCPAFDPGHLWICPLTIIRDVDRYVKGSGRHKLETTCKRWQVELDGAHNALSDARATGRLLHTLAKAGKVAACPLGTLLAHVERRRVEHERDFEAYRARMAAAAAAAPKAEQTSLPLDGRP